MKSKVLGPSDLNPSLMLHPALAKIINLSTLHIEGLSKKMKRHRAVLSSTCLYHTCLDKFFKETSILTSNGYQKRGYLGNVKIEYLPNRSVWKVIITNGGTKRKNAKIQLEVRETLYVRKLQGIYVIDEEFDEETFTFEVRK